jgi:hypothetical protein
VDPHHGDYLDVDQDADPDYDFYLTRIQMPRFTLMRIRIQILASNMAQTLEKVLK